MYSPSSAHPKRKEKVIETTTETQLYFTFMDSVSDTPTAQVTRQSLLTVKLPFESLHIMSTLHRN